MNEITEIKNLSKSEIIGLATDTATDAIEGGYLDPILARIYVDKMELYIKSYKASIKESSIIEAELYDKKELLNKFAGVKLEVSESGIKYDYSNDTEWCELKEKEDGIKSELKARESILKAVKPNTVANPETGEYLAPPVRTSTTSLKLTLK